ncbi:MAG: Arc family DNA-binding protein [Clostridia bacterium]|nr:Arc family DNA-binding protein [Clostridia bacterium]
MGKYRFPQFPIRINPDYINKIRYIATENSRSANKEIEQLIIRYIKEYESRNGEIETEDIERMLASLK